MPIINYMKIYQLMLDIKLYKVYICIVDQLKNKLKEINIIISRVLKNYVVMLFMIMELVNWGKMIS